MGLHSDRSRPVKPPFMSASGEVLNYVAHAFCYPKGGYTHLRHDARLDIKTNGCFQLWFRKPFLDVKVFNSFAIVAPTEKHTGFSESSPDH